MHDNQYPPEPGPAGGCNASGLGCWHDGSAEMRVDRLRACLDLKHCAPPAAARRGQSARRQCGYAGLCEGVGRCRRSEEHTSELQSLMRNSYAVFCLKNKRKKKIRTSIYT